MTDYKKLTEQYGSPLYIFDEEILHERVSNIRSKLPSNAKLCYAIKSNAFLLDSLKDEDILFEVCSPGELSICEKLNVAPEKIVFSGVCKSLEDVKRAYNLRVNTITLESKNHLNHLIEAVKTEPVHTQDVIIRLNGGNQFGMNENDVLDCVEIIKSYKNLNLRGIHYFTGTQKKQKKIAEEVTFIQNFCDELQKKSGIAFNSIEYGPGLSYEYFSAKDESSNFSELEEFSALIKDSKYNYVIELGRYVASPCGKYVTKIMDIKSDNKGNNIIIIDGGINHINYYGQMMGMKNPKIEQISANSSAIDSQNYTIAGSLCTTADIVLRQLPLKSPAEGDLLVFNDIGAYSVTEGIYLFLSHPLPAVILKNKDSYKLKRNSYETFELNFEK